MKKAENEASQFARRSQTLSQCFNGNVPILQSKKFNFLFSLFDHITQLTDLPKFLSFLALIFFYLQVIFSSTWPQTSFYQQSSKSTYEKIIEKEISIFWFMKQENSNPDVNLAIIINSVVFLICAAWFVFISIYYLIRRKFIGWTLYPTRIIYEIICPIFLHPAAAATGVALDNIMDNSSNFLSWLLFIVGFIVYLGFLFTFLIGYSITCTSPVLVTTLFSTFEPFYVKMMTISSSLMIFISYLVKTFEFWVINIIQVIHFAIFLYVFWSLLQLHFHKIEGNVLAFSVLLSSLVLDVLMFILNIVSDATILVPIIALYSLFVVTLIIGHFVIQFLHKKCIKKLKEIDQNRENDLGKVVSIDEDENVFKCLNIQSSSNEALKYLRIGLYCRSKCFLDWSLIREVVNSHKDNTHVLISSLQIMSFFPNKQNIVSGILHLIADKNRFKLSEQFILFQSSRIMIQRQSSIPFESNERMIMLRMNTNDCERVIYSVWNTKTKPTVGVFEAVAKIVDRTDGLFQEAIRDYPNNQMILDDYCRFLIECKTDFKSAIVQKHKKDMIEDGYNFSKDYAFKRFVQNYPLYLKRRTMDVHGNFIKETMKNSNSSASQSSSSSSSTSKQGFSSTDEDIIDFEIESILSKAMLPQARLRMALFNYTKKYHLSLTKFMVVTAIISLAAAIACFTTTSLLLKSWIKERSLDSSNSQKISDSFFNMNIAALDHIISFARETGRYPDSSFLLLQEFSRVESGLRIYISFYGYIKQYATKYVLTSEDSFQQFMNELSEQSTNGMNVYRMAGSMFSNVVPSVACRNNVQSAVFNRSLKDTFSDLFYDFIRLNEVDSKELFTSDAYCEIPKNLALISEPFMQLFISLLTEQNSFYNKFKKNAKIIQIAIPIVCFVFQFFPFMIIGLIFYHKMKQFDYLLMSLDIQTKDSCRKPIMLQSELKEESTQSDHFYIGHRWIFIIIFQAIFSIVSFILLFFLVFIACDTNEHFQRINCWQFLSSKRFILSTEITHFIFQLVMNNGSIPQFLTAEELQKLIAAKIPEIRKASLNMMRGSDVFESSVGYDKELDEINFKDRCSLDNSQRTDSIHDIYRCSSASHTVNVFADFALTILMNTKSYNGIIADPLLINFVHLANSHLFEHLSNSNERLVEMINLSNNKFYKTADIFLVIGFIIGVLTLVFQVYASFYSNHLYHVALSLVRRIPPTLFVANKDLLNFVFNKHTNIVSHMTSCASQSVILNSKNGVIGVSNEGTIELVNKGVTEILGYSPDQLLGQPIEQLFNESDGQKINTKMIEVMNGESSLINEDHLVCIRDNGRDVPCQVFVIGLEGKDSKIESFTFLIKDESSLIEQQTNAEIAKAQSERLLFQILPRSIVTMINRGERDISFTVPSASIIFTDIVRFSEYSACLSPADVMGNLSMIFDSFDENIKKYQLITKIKLIGDIYMAAAGLFVSDEHKINPENHAEQTIQFGLDCLESIEQNNMKLNSSLQLRIGVNTGGPLIAGVLGSDKPVFDIIGDPINVAARLQTTDLPGKIQIPKSTFDLIENKGFVTEERGEVFLKGKGKTMAYFVSPIATAFTSKKNDIV